MTRDGSGKLKGRRNSLWNDLCWAVAMICIRRARREMLFERRIAFDDALRPRLEDGAVIAYPDAVYHFKELDLDRARTVLRRKL